MDSIVALAGRRIDLPYARRERFPARNIESVRRAIQFELKEHCATWLVSSAAAGVDLIGMAAAAALGINRRIVLFTGVREFMQKSVNDRGAYWEREFELLLSTARPENVIIVPAQATDSETFKAVNERILNEATALASLRSSRAISIVAWEGVTGSKGEDFTAHFIECASRIHIPVLTVGTL